MKFTKMHGCGNDYIYVDCINAKIPDNPEEIAIKISDRHFGVGSDGLILILPSDNADAFMQLYNADGSKGTMCGNGIRCTAKYIYDHGIISHEATKTKIETPAGIKEISLDIQDNKVINCTVDMGIAELTSESNPSEKITVNGRLLNFIGAYTGTDHAVYFIEDNPAIKDILTWSDSKFALEGKYFETHSRFINRVNSEFVEIISRNEIKMRVFERGSGETMACGTGATACAFAGVISGKLNHDVLVHLRGGDLRIKVENNNRCFMTGSAVEICEGEYIC